MQRYYFDHNATTPVAPQVVEAMLPVLGEVYGNPSSLHHYGQQARRLLDEARAKVAALLGGDSGAVKPEQIVFTSGGTEADNLAILSVGASPHGDAPGHVITTSVEHPAVLAAAHQLPDVTIVPVDGDGCVDPDAIRRALKPETALISVMHANNELGTLQPIEQIARIAAEAEVPLHSDGVQAAGKIPIDVHQLGVAYYSISGHKINAPKGIGALYVAKGAKLNPRQFGGRQERGRRGGTENIAGAVGLGRAAELLQENAGQSQAELGKLRDHLERALLDRIPDSHVNGAGPNGSSPARTLNTTNLRFDGIDSDALLIALDLKGFAVSSGAACSSGAPEPSHVLLAIGLSKAQARSSIRFSLGQGNDAAQVDALVEATAASVAHLRKLSPVYSS